VVPGEKLLAKVRAGHLELCFPEPSPPRRTKKWDKRRGGRNARGVHPPDWVEGMGKKVERALIPRTWLLVPPSLS